MATWLRQSTASSTILVGPFVDDTDGKTPEESLSITQPYVLLWKQGGSGMSSKNESSTATYLSNGCYKVTLNDTDTGTLGKLTVSILMTGALSVRHDFQVIPQQVWDSYFSTDKLQVDAVEVNSVAASASNLQKAASVIQQGTTDNTAFTATTTIFESDDITEATADHYKGRIVTFTNNALIYQASDITAYSLVAGRGRFTVSALTEAVPDNTTFVIS